MRIVLTNHARLRAAQRGISFEQIVDCILHPDQVSSEPGNKLCFKKLSNTRNSLLLCYTVDQQGKILVITVVKTTKIYKYLT